MLKEGLDPVAPGERANVAIDRYLEHIPKEDQVPKMHELCFELCCSALLMPHCGIAHGRDCEPHYKMMAGDSW